MVFSVPIEVAQRDFPDYEFISALTPSAQKAAFHVIDKNRHELCLKIISPDYDIDRLDREIEAMQKVKHPNVVILQEYTFSSRLDKHQHYIIEEYIEGSDLSVWLTEGDPWPMGRVAPFFLQMCDGLKAIHNNGIVHRDLKPSNIRVRADDTPVIIDFGMARHLRLPDLTSTHQGAAIGTPVYFAPEQFAGSKRDIDTRTDFFALGVMLYQTLVGTHPFFRPSMGYKELSESVCSSEQHLENADFLNLPNEWRLLVDRLLSKDRGGRPHDADIIINILNKLGTAGSF